MHLFGSGTVYDVCVEGGCQESLDLYHQRLDAESYALYRVRRIYTANGKTKRTTVNARRSVETVAQGSRALMEVELLRLAAAEEAEWSISGGWLRFYRHRKGKGYPAIEEFLVVCPDAIKDKCQCIARFEAQWRELAGEITQLSLLG